MIGLLRLDVFAASAFLLSRFLSCFSSIQALALSPLSMVRDIGAGESTTDE